MNRCIILIPLNYNDGTPVPGKVITRIKRELDEAFDGHTIGGTVEGTYRMPDGSMACDACLEVWGGHRAVARRSVKENDSQICEVVETRVDLV